MSVAAAERIQRADSTATAMAGFSRYKPMEENAVRKIEVVENKVLKHLKDLWKSYKCLDLGNDVEADHGYPNYKRAKARFINKPRYSPEDVTLFSVALAEFQEDEDFSSKAGLFLSALMNEGRDQEYLIMGCGLLLSLSHLGCFNDGKEITLEGVRGGFNFGEMMRSGTLTINGDGGSSLGSHMRGGAIVVNGSCEEWPGADMAGGTILIRGDARESAGTDMTGGHLTIEGSVETCLGERMGGGRITIFGNAGRFVGTEMKGGEIHINGDYESIADNIKHGRIFHKGKPLVDK